MDNRQIDGAPTVASGYHAIGRPEPKKLSDSTPRQPNEITPRPAHAAGARAVRRVKVDCGELFRSWAYPKN